MLQNFVKSRNRKEPCATRLAKQFAKGFMLHIMTWRVDKPPASKPSSASSTWRLKLKRSWSTAPGEHILQSAPTWTMSDMAGGRRCINPSMRSDRSENCQCLRTFDQRFGGIGSSHSRYRICFNYLWPLEWWVPTKLSNLCIATLPIIQYCLSVIDEHSMRMKKHVQNVKTA